MWMCMSCAEIMSEVKYAILKEEEMTWFCTSCRGLAVRAAQTDTLIQDRCRHYNYGKSHGGNTLRKNRTKRGY